MVTQAISYERLASGLIVPAGKTEYGFRIEIPYTGFVKKLIVIQTPQAGESPVGFAVDLYNARVLETAQGPPVNTTPKVLARIIPTVTATAGNPVVIYETNIGYVYRNLENSSQSPGIVDRAVYLGISHGAQAFNTTWAVALGILTTG